MRRSDSVLGSALALALFASVPALGHDTAHAYVFLWPDAGGAVTWFSELGGPNVVNNWDLGRQVNVTGPTIEVLVDGVVSAQPMTEDRVAARCPRI